MEGPGTIRVSPLTLLMDRALFIDRDGVLNEDNGYTFKIEDLRILDGVIDGLKIIQDLGYKIIIITNQSGIARGFFTIQDFHDFMKALLEILEENKIFVTDYFFCPHHIEGFIPEYTKACDCRKPRSGMIMQAMQKYNFDLTRSVLIGDKETDILAGLEASISSNILITNQSLSNNSLASSRVENLVSAAQIIKTLD